MNLDNSRKVHFFEFLDSLANATYFNFENIKVHPEIVDLADSINPKDYMYLIDNLTDNLASIVKLPNERKVSTMSADEYIVLVQSLSEFGICYTTNSEIARSLSVGYLLYGKNINYEEEHLRNPAIKAKPLVSMKMGNIFDEQITYSTLGFQNSTGVCKIYTSIFCLNGVQIF